MRLEKEKRLGTGPDGFEKLKKHEFFREINFATILQETPPLAVMSPPQEEPATQEGMVDCGVSYAMIQPGAKLEIEPMYFAESSPALNHHGASDPKPDFAVLKEGKTDMD